MGGGLVHINSINFVSVCFSGRSLSPKWLRSISDMCLELVWPIVLVPFLSRLLQGRCRCCWFCLRVGSCTCWRNGNKQRLFLKKKKSSMQLMTGSHTRRLDAYVFLFFFVFVLNLLGYGRFRMLRVALSLEMVAGSLLQSMQFVSRSLQVLVSSVYRTGTRTCNLYLTKASPNPVPLLSDISDIGWPMTYVYQALRSN